MILSLFIKGMAWIILEKSDEVKKPKVMLRIEEIYRRKRARKKTAGESRRFAGKRVGAWGAAYRSPPAPGIGAT
ncbi:hypothetical protein OII53_04720 [Achromobacter ruhlandii]|uniref:hypothetical protein n=1 Tax=Achromobacter ruhlandii TaxID=72557 RepID=UPI0021F0DC3F|nr:hypothetical protein [Achromobacter ruhlandii]MCV6799709.1 hypothetical protein [Achromobacter ruhlandii]MCV6805206.1 hypothetical protein [Achromobacter ruhlandii]MCV6807920.1 hypothetical protein [Achromobacter ruhlandii]MCV6817822.1 hypothetical protein [Achromobacter ruhlandii]